ncbi:MAG: Uma2 family endonuclease [Lachnospiraceae bacterium]|nr:Uma2 family endonuclease [Lachnospiraceae bacterium]
MGLLKEEYRKQEKMNGVVYDMSPAPGYQHGIINGNIHRIIGNSLKNTLCLVFIENLDFRYQPDINDDYVCPDIMIVCDRKRLKGSFYNGVPKFIVETLSPSTAKRDRTDKKDAYEKAGVEEYWIVSPQGKSIEIYYLEDDKYVLEQSYILQDDKEEEDYNAETEIVLKEFPHIKMKLEEIFEGLE